MARTLSLCAGLGLFCILSSVILIIFAEISQVSPNQTVLRHIQMTTIDTTNFGPYLASQGVDVTNLYGSGVRSGVNTGLRQYYKWGLWTSCESSDSSGTNDAYCDNTSFGYRFVPIDAIYADVPTSLQTTVANTLGNTFFTSSTSGTYTHAAFYLFFIGAILAGLSMITAVLAHRFAFFVSAVTGFLAFLFFAVATAMWTAMLHRMRNAIEDAGLGISVSYGNALWICWGATLAALLSVIPFLLSCCFGGSRRGYDEYADEKY